LPLTLSLGEELVFEIRLPGTVIQFIIKSSLFILLLGFIRRLEMKLITEQKAENIFVAPPYCQTACSSNTCRGPSPPKTLLSDKVSFLLFIKNKQK